MTPTHLKAESGRGSAEQLRDRAEQFVKTDTTLRIPRADADREHGFARWLERYSERLLGVLPDDLAGMTQQHLLSGVSETPREFFRREVWPAVEPLLLGYAIRGLAMRWSRQRMGDAVTFYWPIRSDRFWRVPIGVAGYGSGFGDIVLNEDGVVLEDQSIRREELLEKLRGHSHSGAQAASR